MLSRKLRLKSEQLARVWHLGWRLLPFLGAVLLVWVLILAVPVVPRRFKTALSAVAINGFVVLLGGYLAEIYLAAHAFEGYVRTYPDPSRKQLWSDPVLGWVSDRTQPGVNNQGFRDPRDFTAARTVPSGRIMGLGGSFVWGYPLPADSALPRLLETRWEGRYSVYNVGMKG